jgi:hypothetical protein
MRETVEALRALVKAALPGVHEKPQPRTKTFNYDYDGALLAISGYQNWASVGFVRGDELDDPQRILEGAGKGMRHVQIRRGADIPVDALASLVREAAALNARLGPPRGYGRSWGRDT